MVVGVGNVEDIGFVGDEDVGLDNIIGCGVECGEGGEDFIENECGLCGGVFRCDSVGNFSDGGGVGD